MMQFYVPCDARGKGDFLDRIHVFISGLPFILPLPLRPTETSGDEEDLEIAMSKLQVIGIKNRGMRFEWIYRNKWA